MHSIIYEELCRGIVHDSSRERYLQEISDLVGRGAQGIVLGCTEIELLIRPEDGALAGVPLYPTTRIHATAAVDRALGRAG